MKLRITLLGISALIASANLFGQAVPVVGVADPTPLFKDKDKTLNANKQAAMHIVIDLLAYGHWNEADKWLTEKYIQHNPNFGSGRAPIMAAFGKAAPQPIPADPKDWKTKIVAVTTQGKDVVCVASVSTRPDPRNPGQTYTTTHFDMWRFVDGKADEHWDEDAIRAAGGGQGKGKQ
ncbi:MAG TPA: nuclear transport factor 2 family protein [Bryobacteraceae bacterium]|jgi:predicted SnoaL-like aldol condensation-catalyzing enzyme|nr:nuclear transport factor 2 family protein [Bryobacteraceae bacterium]